MERVFFGVPLVQIVQNLTYQLHFYLQKNKQSLCPIRHSTPESVFEEYKLRTHSKESNN